MGGMPTGLLLAATVTSAACTPALYRHERAVEIRGAIVRLADSLPLPEAEVLLYWFKDDDAVASLSRVFSDQEGRFWLDVTIPLAVPCEQLVLMIRRIGYRTVSTARAALDCSRACQRVTVVLEPLVTTELPLPPGTGIRIGPCV